MTPPDIPADRGGLDAAVISEDQRLRSGTPGLTLAATLHLPRHADAHRGVRGNQLPGLVVAHGAGSNRRRHETFSRMAAAAGFAVLTLDLRGHGESGGAADGAAHHDLTAAASLLRSHHLVRPDRICFRGSSMGAYLGLYAAEEAEFSALALLCPANERVLLEGLEGLNQREEAGEQVVTARLDSASLRQSLQTHNVLDIAEDVWAPALIVHARGDETVPYRDSLELAARLPGLTEVVLLPGGDHRSAQGSLDVHARVIEWLADAVGVSARTART